MRLRKFLNSLVVAALVLSICFSQNTCFSVHAEEGDEHELEIILADGTLFFAMGLDWENGGLASWALENPQLDLSVPAMETVYEVALLQVTKNGESLYTQIPMVSDDVTWFYKAPSSETFREAVVWQEGMSYDETDLFVWQREDTFESGEFPPLYDLMFVNPGEYQLSYQEKNIYVYVEEPILSITDKNGKEVLPDTKICYDYVEIGQTGDSITISAKDPGEYSVFVGTDYCYGVEDGDLSEYFFYADSHGENVTDKLVQISNYEKESVLQEMNAPVFSGTITLTVSDFAHRSSQIAIRYRNAGDEGYTFRYFNWDYKEEQNDLYYRDEEVISADKENQGFAGWLVCKEEFESNDLDYWANKPITVTAHGTSMYEVISCLTDYLEHPSEAFQTRNGNRYEYIMVKQAYSGDDEESIANANSEQYVSTYGAQSAVKGISFVGGDSGYIQEHVYDKEGRDLGAQEIKCAYTYAEDGSISGVIYGIDPYFSYVVQGNTGIVENSSITEEQLRKLGENKGILLLEGNPIDETNTDGFSLVSYDIYPYSYDETVDADVIKVNDTYYYDYNWYQFPSNLPVMHIDATTEVHLHGAYADVEPDTPNIYLRAGEGVRCYVNGECFAVDAGTQLGELYKKSGEFDHWRIGSVSYQYAVVVDKLEVSTKLGVSEESAVSDVYVELDTDTLFGDITGADETASNAYDEGASIVVSLEMNEIADGEISDEMETAIGQESSGNSVSVEYLDLQLGYQAGYGETDDVKYLEETTKPVEISFATDYEYRESDEYKVLRCHEDTVEELEVELSEDEAGNTVVTFETDKFSEYALVRVEETSLVGYSIELNGSIQMAYYISIPKEQRSQEIYMDFSVDGVSQPENKTAVSVEEGYYKFVCDVAAAQMGMPISAVLHIGEEREVLADYSVLQYAKTILENQDGREDYEKAQPLVKAMLNYGGYAQLYFDYHKDEAVNSGLYAAGEDPVKGTSPVISEEYKITGDTDTADFSFYGASLVCQSDTYVKLYFTCKQGASGYSAVATSKEHPAKAYRTKTEVENGMLVVSVYDIAAAELDDTFSIKITGNQRTATVCYSPYHYLKKAIDGTNQNLKALATAMYYYNCSANEYFHK